VTGTQLPSRARRQRPSVEPLETVTPELDEAGRPTRSGGRRCADLAIELGSQAEGNSVAGGVVDVKIGTIDLEGVVAVVARSWRIDLAYELRAETGLGVVGVVGVEQCADSDFAVG